jgi:hypothetical protein
MLWCSVAVRVLARYSRILEQRHLITFLDMCCCGRSPTLADVSEGGLSRAEAAALPRGKGEREGSMGKFINLIKPPRPETEGSVQTVAEAVRT